MSADVRVEATAPATSIGAPRQDSYADRLARRILRTEDKAPQALVPMRGSLMLSAVRCLISYVAIPVLLPLASWLAPLSAPLSLVLTVAAFAMAIVSLRRVWLANWSKRWAYTAFAGTVLVVLAVLIAMDVRTILA